MQVRHDSFHVPEFVAMCRAADVAIVYADSPDYPAIADVTGDFVYARLENTRRGRAGGLFAGGARSLGDGREGLGGGRGSPAGLPYVGEPPAKDAARHVRLLHLAAPRCAIPPRRKALIARV